MNLLLVLQLVFVILLAHHHQHYGEEPQSHQCWSLKEKMSVNPFALLSSEDFAQFLEVSCSKTTNALLKDERDHTNEKIKIVVQSLVQRIDSLKNDYETKIDNLEKQVKELLADVNLKTDTLSLYQNQLLFNLKGGIQGALAQVDEDIRVLSNEIRTCNICAKSFATLKDLQNHILCEHSLHSSFPCQLCGKTFSSFNELNAHTLGHAEHPDIVANVQNTGYSYQDTNDLQINNPCPVPVPHNPHHCYICDEDFATFNALSNHTKAVHNGKSYECRTCGETLQSSTDLEKHMLDVHRSDTPSSCYNDTEQELLLNYSCDLCNQAFTQFPEYCDHIKDNHASCTIFPCYDCEKTFSSLSALELHIEKNHVGSECEILQLDGQDDGLDLAIAESHSDVTVRTADYAFNQTKQTEKIVKDATKPDYDVNVNNNDQNATIKCSPGFYIQVARASLGSLKNPSVLACGDIAVIVDDIKITKDQIGTEATKLISFSFMNNQRSIGHVSVHLHHSTRTIQVQGSAVMPNNTRAALWFLNNFLLVRFKEQAKAKNFAIKSINTAILQSSSASNSRENIQDSSANFCSLCNREFNTKCRPSRCEICAKFFHRTNCLKDHNKHHHPNSRQTQRALLATSTTTVSRSTTSSVPAPSLPNPLYSQASFPQLQSTLTFVPITSSSSSSMSRTSSSQVHSSITFVPSSLSGAEEAAAATTTTGSLTTSATSSNPPPRQGSRKNPKPFVPISPDQARIEFLQTELSAAQARISQLDSSLKDKENRVSILMARIKILEDQRTGRLYENYFPTENISSNHSQPQSSCFRSCSQHPSPSAHHCSPCHFQHVCCQQKLQCNDQCRSSPSPTTISSEFETAITVLQAQVHEILKIINSKQNHLESNEDDDVSIPNSNPKSPANPTQKLGETFAQNIDSSITSIEEFINVDTLPSPPPLNSQLPTIQQ